MGPVSMAGLPASSKGWPLLVPGSLWSLLSSCVPACFSKTKPPSVPARTVSSVGVLSASLSAAKPLPALSPSPAPSFDLGIELCWRRLSWPQRCVCNPCLVARPCVRGAELDLRKAFHSVLHDVAFCAGASAGVARAVLDYMRRMVWSAPRHCIVYGPTGSCARFMWPACW